MDKERERLYKELKKKIGNTSLYKLKNVSNNNLILIKCENQNPTGSMFDRLYINKFYKAEKDGFIVPGITPLIECSIGNAGASFAWTARELGYSDYTVITLDNIFKTRIQQIESLGAKLILVDGKKGPMAYIKKLEEILDEDKKKKGGSLGENPERIFAMTKIQNNPIFYKDVVDEIYNQIIPYAKEIDYFFSVVGSGSTISGYGNMLKTKNSLTKIIAVDHEGHQQTFEFLKNNRVLDYNGRWPHPYLGAGTWGIPLEKLCIDFKVIDDIVVVSDDDWKNALKILNEYEKLNAGMTSGGSLAAAINFSNKVNNKIMLTMIYDADWKYK